MLCFPLVPEYRNIKGNAKNDQASYAPKSITRKNNPTDNISNDVFIESSLLRKCLLHSLGKWNIAGKTGNKQPKNP